jgi:hypothetical protein
MTTERILKELEEIRSEMARIRGAVERPDREQLRTGEGLAALRTELDALRAEVDACRRDLSFGLWGNRKTDGLAYQEELPREWLAENREAIEAYNERVEREGLILEEFRRF